MKRACLVTHAFPPQLGGVEAVVAELAKRLPDHGWEVEVLTQAPAAAAEITADGTRVRRFPTRLRWSRYPTAPGLWRHLRRTAGSFDVVHGHNFHALPALGAAALAEHAFVFSPHYHGLGTSRLGRLVHLPYRPAGRYVFRRAEQLICGSTTEAERVLADFPAAAGRLTVVPLGVDLAAIRAAEPYPTDVPVVFTAGRLHPYKRVDRVLAALARLDGPVRLVVAGDGSAAGALREQAAALGLGDRVTFAGTMEREVLLRWLRTASVYISLSEQEAFGIGVAEGAGAGARVLAGDIGSHREIAAMAPDAVELVPAHAGADAVAAMLRAALDAPRPPAATLRIPSWDDVARSTAAVYEEACRSR